MNEGLEEPSPSGLGGTLMEKKEVRKQLFFSPGASEELRQRKMSRRL